MPVFIHELLCVDSLGNVSISHLTIEDDDPHMASEEADAIYTLDGTVLAAPPVVTTGQIQLTLANGSSFTPGGMTFTDNGNRYFLLPDDWPAAAFVSAGTYFPGGVVGSIAYNDYGAINAEVLRPYQGMAYAISTNSVNPPVVLGAGVFTVYDDDNKIELASETGAMAQGHFGYHGQRGEFTIGAGDPGNGFGATNLRLVEVDYSSASGGGTFEAIEFTFIRFGTTYTVHIPRTGTVDVTTITAITAVTLAAGSLDGLKYGDFGLNFQKTAVNGTDLADLLRGSWVNQDMSGKGGADTLAGSSGEDELYGGKGNDDLYGGLHADTLDGGSGGDALYGGAQNDSLLGGDKGDDLFGGFDNDTLDGGKGDDSLSGDDGSDLVSGGTGHDSLQGGAGNDTVEGDGGDDDLGGGGGADHLSDGSGQDTLTGNSGADTFVFAADGSEDTIADFKDGTDLIDLDVAFAALTLTDVSPGEVHVTHSGETLVILDTSGTLTAASLTAADFI